MMFPPVTLGMAHFATIRGGCLPAGCGKPSHAMGALGAPGLPVGMPCLPASMATCPRVARGAGGRWHGRPAAIRRRRRRRPVAGKFFIYIYIYIYQDLCFSSMPWPWPTAGAPPETRNRPSPASLLPWRAACGAPRPLLAPCLAARCGLPSGGCQPNVKARPRGTPWVAPSARASGWHGAASPASRGASAAPGARLGVAWGAPRPAWRRASVSPGARPGLP